MKDKDRTPIYTIMQRLHEDDTTGHELKKEGKVIKHICLPCELSDLVKPEELKSFYKDGLLDPVRLSRSALEKQRIDLGSFAYSGQYEQNPVIEGGNIVKKEWLTTIKQQDFDYIYKREGKPAIHFFVDTAFTEKQTNDPTGIIGAVYMDNKVFIPSAIKVRKEFPELIAFLPEWVKANKYDYRSTIRIEPKANGLSVIQQLKQMTDLNITNTPSPTDSKETRLRSNTGIIECGRFVLVEGAWNEEFIDELCGFPTKIHDEYVDLTNYAIDYFINDAIEPVDEEQLINDFL
jgi:predicted phage terminase large subunit-like protein